MPLLVIAGLIEGFVSPTGLDPLAKFTIGASMFVLLAMYLGLAGRQTSADRVRPPTIRPTTRSVP